MKVDLKESGEILVDSLSIGVERRGNKAHTHAGIAGGC